jgi:type 1 glutamine amidotransferase
MTQILLFTKTAGYRHEEVIDIGIAMIRASAAGRNVEVTATEDSAIFTPDGLAPFDAVVWFQVSGDVLDEEQRAAFDSYLRGGGGFAAIHGPADAEWSWPEYASILGARFLYHPENGTQHAQLRIEDPEHPSTDKLTDPWGWTEEWYVFDRNPRGDKHILLTVDESTYDVQAQKMGADHPISWLGQHGHGRTWYTSLGHHPESYKDQQFIDHVWGGIASVFRR